MGDMSQAISRLSVAGVSLHSNGKKLVVESDSPLTNEQREYIKGHKPEILAALQAANDTDRDTLPDADMEHRRRSVLKMLAQNPEIEQAWVAAGETDPVRVHLAIRGKGTCELTIAADRWDEFTFLELLERQSGEA